MKKIWESMTTYEKDLFIAREILRFSCFCKDGGTDWYNEQYSFGHWRYSTNLEDALDLFKRVMGEDKQAHIIMGIEDFQCNVIREGSKSLMVNLTSNSLPELFCLISIHLRGRTVQPS
ncbi:hypothetical protein [Fictibacillus terranigra]|uniref:Uncharacterized protein n=1 Tax=Fictibacillus terranigra TaxID=3058424 RepID=A0ABT8ED72_9BACL|nr:hypothetical protein [Fictibacillus sp. CENA-BCM004]MDN4075854.1 hypothetical protein [Fictibacillus sp. CENA-BCM004]